MPRTKRPMKQCATPGCTNMFESSEQDYTVNCPEHRGRKHSLGGKSVTVTDSDRAKFYNQGYDDGLKADKSKGKMASYRNAAFGYAHGRLIQYEAGFNDAWNGHSRNP